MESHISPSTPIRYSQPSSRPSSRSRSKRSTPRRPTTPHYYNALANLTPSRIISKNSKHSPNNKDILRLLSRTIVTEKNLLKEKRVQPSNDQDHRDIENKLQPPIKFVNDNLVNSEFNHNLFNINNGINYSNKETNHSIIPDRDLHLTPPNNYTHNVNLSTPILKNDLLEFNNEDLSNYSNRSGSKLVSKNETPSNQIRSDIFDDLAIPEAMMPSDIVSKNSSVRNSPNDGNRLYDINEEFVIKDYNKNLQVKRSDEIYNRRERNVEEFRIIDETINNDSIEAAISLDVRNEDADNNFNYELPPIAQEENAKNDNFHDQPLSVDQTDDFNMEDGLNELNDFGYGDLDVGYGSERVEENNADIERDSLNPLDSNGNDNDNLAPDLGQLNVNVDINQNLNEDMNQDIEEEFQIHDEEEEEQREGVLEEFTIDDENLEVFLPGTETTPSPKTSISKTNTASKLRIITNSNQVNTENKLPVSQIKKIMNNLSSQNFQPEILNFLQSTSQEFFQQLTGDLNDYVAHGKRKTINIKDVLLYMKRIRFDNDIDNNEIWKLCHDNLSLDNFLVVEKNLKKL